MKPYSFGMHNNVQLSSRAVEIFIFHFTVVIRDISRSETFRLFKHH